MKELFCFRIGNARYSFRAANTAIKDFLNYQENKNAVIRASIEKFMRRDEWSGTENKRLKKLLSNINVLGQDLNEVARAANKAALAGSSLETDKDLEEIVFRYKRCIEELKALNEFWSEPSDLFKKSASHNVS